MPAGMTLTQVEELLETCRRGSIAAAARALGKSRGAVSMSLSALEDQLGVTLLARSGNRVAPTPLGEELLDDFQRLLDLSRGLEERCRRHLEGDELLLRIARDDTLPEAFWRGVVVEMTRAFPRLNLCFGLAPAAALASSLAGGAVDLGLGVMEEEVKVPGAEGQVLARVDMLMVAAPSHPLARLGRVTSRDLQDHPLIGQTWFDERGLRNLRQGVQQRVGVSHFELMRDMAAEGIGWALLPMPLIAGFLAERRLVVLRHARAVQAQDFVALHARDFRDGRASEWLQQRIRRYLAEHGRLTAGADGR